VALLGGWVGLRGRRTAPRALAAFFPVAAAACSAFGVSSPASPDDPELPPDSAADTQPSDGGSEEEGRDGSADGPRLPDGAPCTVVEDDFESSDWTPEPKWRAEKTEALLMGQVTSARMGQWSLRFQGSATLGGYVKLVRPLEQACTLRFKAWLLVKGDKLKSRIVAITRQDGPALRVEMQGNQLAIVQGLETRERMPLPEADWRRLEITYTTSGDVTLGLDLEKKKVNVGADRATGLEFGLLGAESGTDEVFFDDVVLEY